MKGNKVFPLCRSNQRRPALASASVLPELWPRALDGHLSFGLGRLSRFSHTTTRSSPRGNPHPVLSRQCSMPPVPTTVPRPCSRRSAGAGLQASVTCVCTVPHRVQVRVLEHGRPDPQRVRDALRDLRCPREPGLARGHQALLELAHHPPQVYVEGEFLGGCDVMVETYQSGELAAILEKANAQCLVSLSLRRIRRVRRLDRGTSLSGRLSQKAPAAAC